MRPLVRTTLLTFTFATLLAATASSAAAYVFWGASVGGPAIVRADVGGGDVTSLRAVSSPAYGLAVDDTHVYWTNDMAGTIGRMGLDGSGASTGFVSAGGSPTGVAVDDTSIYWTDEAAGTIHRADLDGTDATVLVTLAPGSEPAGIAVDDTYLYWAEDASGAIGRATLDGGSVQPAWIAGVAAGESVAVDATHVYWTRAQGIGRAAIDGTGVDEDFIAVDFPAEAPFAVAVDAHHVYWSDTAGETIERASLDGSGRTTLAEASGPYGLAVNTRPIVELVAPVFPDQVVGTVGPSRQLTVTNHGGGDLVFTRLTMDLPPGFTDVSHDCFDGPIAPGGTCAVTMRFAPETVGPTDGAVSFESNASSSPDEASFSATGLAPPAVAFGAAPDFPDELVGATGPARTVTVTNGGGVDLTVSGVTLAGADAGQFTVEAEDCTAAPIAPSGTCEVTLRFRPTSAGAKAAELSIASDAPSSPDGLAIAATALAPPAPPAAPRPPLVTAIEPGSGTPAGGERLILTGSYLSPVTEVRFGSVAVPFELLGFDRLAVVAPPHEPGEVEVVVVGPGGRSAPVPYRYVAPAPLPLAPLPVVVDPPATGCVVPDLVGKRRGAARRALTRAGCALGAVRRTRGVPLRRQRVRRQSPAAGATLPHGAEVAIRLRPRPRG